MKHLKYCIFIFIIIFSASLFADEYPRTGNVYGVKENKHIKYFCEKESHNILSCSFEMTNVRPKLKKSDYDAKLKEEIARALDEYQKYPPKEDKEKCKKTKNDIKEIISIYEGKSPIPKEAKITKEELEQYKPIHIEDLKKSFNAMVKLECNPSKDFYKTIPKFQLDKELRTCLVGNQTWKQTFKKAGDSWINNAGPQGVCGTVDLSRFVKAKSTFDKIVFWNYISEKNVTNKSADSGIGLMKCSDFDEGEYEFTWNNSSEFPVSCDYVEWSMY